MGSVSVVTVATVSYWLSSPKSTNETDSLITNPEICVTGNSLFFSEKKDGVALIEEPGLALPKPIELGGNPPGSMAY